jgi:hypothetical protein
VEPQFDQEGTGATMRLLNLGMGSTYEKDLFYNDQFLVYEADPNLTLWARLCEVFVNPLLGVL